MDQLEPRSKSEQGSGSGFHFELGPGFYISIEKRY